MSWRHSRCRMHAPCNAIISAITVVPGIHERTLLCSPHTKTLGDFVGAVVVAQVLPHFTPSLDDDFFFRFDFIPSSSLVHILLIANIVSDHIRPHHKAAEADNSGLSGGRGICFRATQYCVFLTTISIGRPSEAGTTGCLKFLATLPCCRLVCTLFRIEDPDRSGEWLRQEGQQGGVRSAVGDGRIMRCPPTSAGGPGTNKAAVLGALALGFEYRKGKTVHRAMNLPDGPVVPLAVLNLLLLAYFHLPQHKRPNNYTPGIPFAHQDIEIDEMLILPSTLHCIKAERKALLIYFQLEAHRADSRQDRHGVRPQSLRRSAGAQWPTFDRHASCTIRTQQGCDDRDPRKSDLTTSCSPNLRSLALCSDPEKAAPTICSERVVNSFINTGIAFITPASAFAIASWAPKSLIGNVDDAELPYNGIQIDRLGFATTTSHAPRNGPSVASRYAALVGCLCIIQILRRKYHQIRPPPQPQRRDIMGSLAFPPNLSQKSNVKNWSTRVLEKPIPLDHAIFQVTNCPLGHYLGRVFMGTMGLRISATPSSRARSALSYSNPCHLDAVFVFDCHLSWALPPNPKIGYVPVLRDLDRSVDNLDSLNLSVLVPFFSELRRSTNIRHLQSISRWLSMLAQSLGAGTLSFDRRPCKRRRSPGCSLLQTSQQYPCPSLLVEALTELKAVAADPAPGCVPVARKPGPLNRRPHRVIPAATLGNFTTSIRLGLITWIRAGPLRIRDYRSFSPQLRSLL
ncbi:uncharacterized protein CLUP02_03570 [Colletotrichum lupini]|uniref:Uncharacterized protein n=1 Tax=Colletotrichum lupini TaxID=145971 RepID=A0A9Q8WCH0_9PEZI|nr:uncharacterized protein CLUP02_03570 [Colletotrichum lupini]UQC78096.1 hypothetical protein CLUP02_03570 [Colletotrichum lupini]